MVLDLVSVACLACGSRQSGDGLSLYFSGSSYVLSTTLLVCFIRPRPEPDNASLRLFITVAIVHVRQELTITEMKMQMKIIIMFDCG